MLFALENAMCAEGVTTGSGWKIVDALAIAVEVSNVAGIVEVPGGAFAAVSSVAVAVGRGVGWGGGGGWVLKKFNLQECYAIFQNVSDRHATDGQNF
jgi:hypothetical protein